MTSLDQLVPTARGQTLDVETLRKDFPILSTKVHGKPLVYLDNAATSQKPRQVIRSLEQHYTTRNANIHRGVHYLGEQSTQEYERARVKAQRFVNAARPEEIVFVRGTTEAVNLVADSYGRKNLGPGDEIIVSAMEHHSNIVPWQLLCDATGAVLRVAPMDISGTLLLDDFERCIGSKTKLAAIVHVSNSLGTINPIKELVSVCRERNVPVLVDGAQAAPHGAIDVQELGCDFYTVSGHKIFGPTGIGILYGRFDLLSAMPPYQGGGEMIRSVTFEETTYAPPPAKFEAGTPNIAGAIGLGVAMEYLQQIGWELIHRHEQQLLRSATEQLSAIPGVRIVGTADPKASVVSFVVDGIHAHDVGTIVDQEGIAIRTGHHCTQPVMDFFGVPATARASFAFYNTLDEVDALAMAVDKARRLFH